MKLLSIYSFKNSLLAVQELGVSAFIAVTQVQSLVRKLRSCNLRVERGEEETIEHYIWKALLQALRI